MRATPVVIAIIICSVFVANAGKRYVDPVDGSDDYSGVAESLAWKSIPKANQALVPGDTVYLKAGTYTTPISPKNSGTVLQPIVYMNFGNDRVRISDAVYGINLDGKSYVAVTGIDFRNLDRFVYVRNRSNHNTIARCTFDSARTVDGKTATWAGSVISGGSQYNHIDRCRFSN